MKKSIVKNKYIFFYLGIFAIAFYIFFNTPYCHDEWKWGIQQNLDMLRTGFKNYNGRYLGNILALIITRSILAKAGILALIFIGMLATMHKLCRKEEEKQNWVLLIFLTLLVWMVPDTLYQQIYGWPAAFVNFVPSIPLFLIYFNWTRDIYYEGEIEKHSVGKIVISFIMAVAMQLFSENITLYVVAYSFWLILIAAIRYKRVFAMHLSFLLGSISGAAIMFSNGAYGRAADNTDGYKHISFSIASMIGQFCYKISDTLFLDNWLLNILLAILIIALIVKAGKLTWETRIHIIVLVGYALYSVWHKVYPTWCFTVVDNYEMGIRTLLAGCFWLAVVWGIWKYTGKAKYEIVVLYISALIVSMPLLVANPIGPRCFYMAYILEVVVIGKLAGIAAESVLKSAFTPSIVGILLICVLAVYGHMAKGMGYVDRIRADIIKEALEDGKDVIVLPEIPYIAYHGMTIAEIDSWENAFKEFYGIPMDVDVIYDGLPAGYKY